MMKRSLKSNLSLYCLTNIKLQKIIILLAEEAWPDYRVSFWPHLVENA